MPDVLDSPIWGALVGEHAPIAEVQGTARRYPADVSVMGAVDPEHDDPVDDLLELLGARDVVGMIETRPIEDPRLHVLFREPLHQYVLEHPVDGEPVPDVVELGARDWDEMAALVELTKPGPWATRTATLGTYLGVRRKGRLVAMAGERMHPTGATEISAVCTHPDARRRGLAAVLTVELARRIQARGELPFLHTRASNEPAQRVYVALGFELRTEFDIVGVAPKRS